MAVTDVYILNVGAGSCVVIDHPSGRKSMIDINNGGELRDYEKRVLAQELFDELIRATRKLENPIDWYQRAFGKGLWRFILTHPDADHMAGIRHVLTGAIEPTVFWDPRHNRQQGGLEDFQNQEAYDDWKVYDAFHRDQPCPWGSWPQRISPVRFESEQYWAHDHIEVLSPSSTLAAACDRVEDWNNLSYVLRVSCGGRSILIPGDIEQKGWDDLAADCELRDVDLAADILLASHHGRTSGYPGNGIIDKIAPSAVIISTAKIPAKEDAVPLYKSKVDNQVHSTRDHGTILVKIYDTGEVNIFSNLDGRLVVLGTMRPRSWFFAA